MMNDTNASAKIFVGSLNYATDDAKLQEYFEQFGKVISAKVITDRDTGRSRGFGFVEFEDEAAAQAAVSGANDQEVDGRRVKVSMARPMQERGPRNDM